MLSSDPTNHTIIFKLTVEDQLWARKVMDADQIERESHQTRTEEIVRKDLISHKKIRAYTTAE